MRQSLRKASQNFSLIVEEISNWMKSSTPLFTCDVNSVGNHGRFVC